MGNILKPAWRFSQHGNLWSIYNAGKNFITGETREEKKKLPLFFTVNAKTGEVILRDYQLNEENALISSIASSDKYLFLHRLINPELPIHRGIIAVDIHSGEIIWKNEEYEYMFHTNDAVYTKITKFENFEYQKLDINSGNLIKNYSENDTATLFELRRQLIEENYENEKDFPVYNIEYSSEDAKDIFNREINIDTGNYQIEFIEKDKLLIFTYHKALADNCYQVFICIYNLSDKKRLFKETIYKQAPLVFPDNFFIMDNFLYFIKEKKEIVAINLNL